MEIQLTCDREMGLVSRGTGLVHRGVGLVHRGVGLVHDYCVLEGAGN